MPADEDPGRHGGEHGRDVESLRRQVSEVARQQRKADLRLRMVDAAAHRARRDRPRARSRSCRPRRRRGAGPRPKSRTRCRPRLRPPSGRGQAQLGVADLPLALDHDDDLARDAEPPGDRRRGQWIRRRDDGAEDERLLPGETGDDFVRDERDAAHRREHEPDREHADRCRVRTELAQRGGEGGRVEQRRQERDEDDVRRQLDVRHPREQADDEPGRRRGGSDTARAGRHEHEQRTRRGQQDEQLQPVRELDGATLVDGGALDSRGVRVWIDSTASAHPPVFRPLIGLLRARGAEVEITTREYGQTLELLRLHGLDGEPIGRHAGRSRAEGPGDGRLRSLRRWAKGRRFDVALAHGSHELTITARSLDLSGTTFDYEWPGPAPARLPRREARGRARGDPAPSGSPGTGPPARSSAATPD